MRGWTVVFALVRGGGDHSMAWADAARTWRREYALNDFEDVIRDAQAVTGCGPKQTVVYGRSAGGLLIGSLSAKYGTRLFGTVYGEVPYLDVLRTTTNPNLPLTELEYEEFGHPAEKLVDLATLARISPVDRIPEAGLPGLRVLLRTGENDMEVLPYEPVKWITRARSGRDDKNKLLAYSENEGHFVDGSSLLEERATDLAILMAWQQKM
jgi:oligopeptidase B